MMMENLKNKTFYALIAGCLVGLFAIIFVPCFIAMGVAHCCEKRQKLREALAREDDGDDDSTDYLVYGPFPYGSSFYGVDEVGESSGYRAPQNSAEFLDSAIQIDAMQDDAAVSAMGYALTALEQEMFLDLHDLPEPQYEGKGKAPMYAPIQALFAEQPEQQLAENAQVQLHALGSIQESIAEATATPLVELPAEQTAADESQDATEFLPEAAPTESEQQLLAKKQE